ncbi:hypothetical protein [Aestuariivirga sp.]|uniref:hypothetical protein n=1 Tax=Aestuariivirga sp. TaxID=2650926 RepID=UPI0035945277
MFTSVALSFEPSAQLTAAILRRQLALPGTPGAGKPVLCEKPLSQDVQACLAVLDAEEVSLAHDFRAGMGDCWPNQNHSSRACGRRHLIVTWAN